jgi:hypothetical protein
VVSLMCQVQRMDMRDGSGRISSSKYLSISALIDLEASFYSNYVH